MKSLPRIIAALLGGIIVGRYMISKKDVPKCDRTNNGSNTGLSSPSSSGSMQQSTKTTDRYALILQLLNATAAIATLVTVILALEQIRVARTQLQPSFQVTTRAKRIPGNNPPITEIYTNDRLILTMDGNARNVVATLRTYFIYFPNDHRNIVTVTEDDNWWEENDAEPGQISRWSADPSRLQPLVGSFPFPGLRMIDFLIVVYTDVFGKRQNKIFVIDGDLGTPGVVQEPDRAITSKCLQLFSKRDPPTDFSSNFLFRRPLHYSDFERNGTKISVKDYEPCSWEAFAQASL